MAVVSDLGVIDVAAWHPESNTVTVWTGIGFALGEWQISEHVGLDAGGGLRVFRSVIDWLRAGCQGIVIIRKNATARLLRNVGVLIADDERHRHELQAIWAQDGPSVTALTLELEQKVAA